MVYFYLKQNLLFFSKLRHFSLIHLLHIVPFLLLFYLTKVLHAFTPSNAISPNVEPMPAPSTG